MYGATVTYQTDHSDIFSEQVNNNFTVHSITYGTGGLAIQCTVSTTVASLN
jgi:hypothetical protein